MPALYDRLMILGHGIVIIAAPRTSDLCRRVEGDRGTEAHAVTADDNRAFDSPVVNPGETYKRTFTQASRYPYRCSFHP